MNQFKYIFGSICGLPFFPIMYFQGKKILDNMPDLPPPVDTKGILPGKHGKKSVLIMGESTIAGIGASSHQNALVGALCRSIHETYQCTVEYEVVAKSGYTAQQVIDDLLPTVKTKSVDYIVIGLGANDTFQLTNPKKWGERVAHLLMELRDRYKDAKIIFINMAPVRDFLVLSRLLKFFLGQQIDLLGDELTKTIRNFDNVYFIEDRIALEDYMKKTNHQYRAEDFFSDGVHPSELTYNMWGKDIGRFVTSLG